MSEKGSESNSEGILAEVKDRLNKISMKYSVQSVRGAFEKLQGIPYNEQEDIRKRGGKVNENFTQKVEDELQPIVSAYGADIVKEILDSFEKK